MAFQKSGSPRHLAWRVTVTYVAVAAVWVVGAEVLLPASRSVLEGADPTAGSTDRLIGWRLLAGGLLIAATALALYLLLNRSFERARAAEESLRQARKLEALGLLAGGVAHDFNNLLVAVSGYAELAQKHVPEGNPAREELTGIRQAVERGTDLTRQLLALSARTPREPSPLDLNAVLLDLGRMLPRVLGGSVELTLRTEAHQATILADLSRVEQLVLNLCINARDSMPEGGQLGVRTETCVAAGGERRVALIVSDTGTGMDAATRARMFEPFFSTKRPEQGSGLGLAAVQSTVQQSGGTIACTSAPGAGTSFRIEFPLVPAAGPRPEPFRAATPPPAAAASAVPSAAAGAPAADAMPSAAAAATAPAESISAAGRTGLVVMVVDDDPSVCGVVRGMLEAEGHSTIVAGDGAVALARLRTTRADLVICDMLMPRKEGIETCTELRRLYPGLPFIAMSGAPEGANYMRIAIKLGATGSLAKPFSRESLRNAIDHALAVDQG